MGESEPLISVVMPVYNNEKYLSQAIESILSQTFYDFEFIIVCEYGTNDKTIEILEYYLKADSRIILIKNVSKLGISASLNAGIQLSKSEYIARMDSDDVALPNRLKVQIDFMNEHTDVDICCSDVDYINGSGKKFYCKNNLSENPEQIKSDLLFFCFIHHPSVMFRKSALLKYNLFYNETFVKSEDLELWCRASHLVKITKIPQVLLQYRWHPNSASHDISNISEKYNLDIMRNNLRIFDIEISEKDLKCLLRTTCRENFFNYRKIEKRLNCIHDEILNKNREFNIYDEACLIKTLNKRMYWKKHKIRRLTVVFIKSLAQLFSNETMFFSAVYLELNGFTAVLKRIFS